MNHLKKRRITIEYWVWEPFEAQVQVDEDEILHMLKERKLLPHCGYTKTSFQEVAHETTNEQA